MTPHPGTRPPHIVELMHAEIDGVNTPAQSHELEEYLAAHPDAREEFDGLSALARRLDEEPQVEPPAHLIHRILSAVPFGRYPRARAEGGVGEWLSRLFPRPRLRYVSTFAVGLLAGFFLLWATVANHDTVEQPLDISNLYGTMKTINPSDGFDVVGTVGVDLDDVRGEIRLHESDRKLLADVTLNATDEIEWVLSYGRSGVDFEGFRQLAGPSSNIVAAGNQMKVSQVGQGRYILFFTEHDSTLAPMMIEIFKSGNLLYQHELANSRGR